MHVSGAYIGMAGAGNDGGRVGRSGRAARIIVFVHRTAVPEDVGLRHVGVLGHRRWSDSVTVISLVHQISLALGGAVESALFAAAGARAREVGSRGRRVGRCCVDGPPHACNRVVGVSNGDALSW